MNKRNAILLSLLACTTSMAYTQPASADTVTVTSRCQPQGTYYQCYESVNGVQIAQFVVPANLFGTYATKQVAFGVLSGSFLISLAPWDGSGGGSGGSGGGSGTGGSSVCGGITPIPVSGGGVVYPGCGVVATNPKGQMCLNASCSIAV
jgi:hypothetical protein